MAATSRKPSKGQVGESSDTRPDPGSKPSKVSQDALRVQKANRASLLLKQVSDPTRLQLVVILAEGERDVDALCALLGQIKPAVGHHLALLRHLGLIAPRRKGAINEYGLTDEGRAVAHAVRSLVVHATAAQPREAPPKPPMVSPRSGDKKPVASPQAPVSRPERKQLAEDESRVHMSPSRAALMPENNPGALNDEESFKRDSRFPMQREFPAPIFRQVRAEQVARDVLVEVQQSQPMPLVLELFVGEEQSDFSDTGSAADWIREFRKSALTELRDHLPIFLVFAEPGETSSELTLELGAVVLDRDGQNVAALHRWMASLPVTEIASTSGDWLTNEEGKTLGSLPEDTAMFGRQPTHVPPFDQDGFKMTLQGLRASPWWRLDY